MCGPRPISLVVELPTQTGDVLASKPDTAPSPASTMMDGDAEKDETDGEAATDELRQQAMHAEATHAEPVAIAQLERQIEADAAEAAARYVHAALAAALTQEDEAEEAEAEAEVAAAECVQAALAEVQAEEMERLARSFTFREEGALGMSLGFYDGFVQILRVKEGGAAHAAGLVADSSVLRVNGTPASELSEEAVRQLVTRRPLTLDVVLSSDYDFE